MLRLMAGRNGSGSSLLSLLALLAVAGLAPRAALAHTGDPEAELKSRIESFKQQIRQASSLDAKFDVLHKLQAYLKDDAPALAKEPQLDAEHRRKLRFTVSGLGIYLEPIDERSETLIRSGLCETVRERILFSVDPKHDPPNYVPGEAQEALGLVDLLCKG